MQATDIAMMSPRKSVDGEQVVPKLLNGTEEMAIEDGLDEGTRDEVSEERRREEANRNLQSLDNLTD